MLNSILSKYYPSSSLLHHMHVVVKLLSFFLFLILSWISDNIWFHFVLLMIPLVLVVLSQVPYRIYMKPLWGMKYFFLFLFFINFCFGISLSSNLVMMMRLIEVLLYTSVITLTTKTMMLIYGLRTVMKPFKCFHIPIDSIAMILTLAIQFIPNLVDQANKILKSLASRGLDYEYASLKQKWEILKAVITPMFLLSFRRADHLAEAMELRHYHPDEPRTYLKRPTYQVSDIAFLGLHLLLFMLFLWKEVFSCVF